MSDTTTLEERDEARMSLIEHLTELRDRLIKIVLAVVVGMLLAFLLYNRIFDFLLQPYEHIANSKNSLTHGKLLQVDPLEGFGIRMKLALYGGIGFAMPVIMWQVWRFVTPGLYAREKRLAIPFLASALSLFVAGAGIAYWTLPKALQFLVQIGGEDNFVTAFAPGKYFTLIVYMMLAFGLGFEFPILLIFLMMAGVISVQNLRTWRRYAIVGICVVVAVITPSGDPISMLALAIPMCLFYEISIVVGWAMQRRKRARAAVAS
jgi:sec-independent protein translocase protein TatC